MRKLWVVLLLVFPIVARAGFDLPGVGDIKIPVKIPGLDRLMNPNEDPITTSIKDAVTEIPFLDAYAPERGALIGLLPHGPKGTIYLLPGLWEGTFRSYCLHAGTYGPTAGDGYLYAPLKGPMAPTIQHILENSVDHPEIPQSQVQTLIWAILARTKIADCDPEIQQTAQTLMTKDEIDKCNGGALGKIPPEALNQVMGSLPPAAQQVLHAEDTIRGMLGGAVHVPYEQLEEVAVLQGDVEPPKGSREVPGGRWSYHPQGFFVRFFPNGYKETRTQYYTPEAFKIEADGQGRITAIEDAQGVRVETTYDEAAGALAFGGDGAVKAYAFASIKMTGPDPKKLGQSTTVEVTGAGWTMVGTPNGKGRAGAAGKEFGGAQDRYNWAAQQWKAIGTLNATIGKLNPKRVAPKAAALGNLMDLASYAEGLRAALAGESDEAKWAVAQVGVVYRTWMTGASNLGAEAGTADAGTRLASAGDFRIADVSPMTPIPRHPGPGGGGSGGFGPGGGSASPGNTGKQRLAQSGGKTNGGNGGSSSKKAKKANKAIATGTTAVEWGHTLAAHGSVWGLPPYEIPLQLAEIMIDEVSDLWDQVCDALSGDPPRDDYQQIATAEKPKFTPITGDGKVSKARVDAFNAYLDASVDLAVKLHAMSVSRDRHGGAMKAGDFAAAYRQVRSMAHWERQGGFAMLTAADKLEALVKVCRDEGFKFPVVTPEMRKAYQDDLRAKGLSAKHIAAARSLGMTDAEIEAGRQFRLQPIQDDTTASLDQLEEDQVEAFRELGAELILVPVVEVPTS